MSNSIINISIDCSKIDKSKLVQGKYLNVTVAPRKEKDQYGNTHTIYYQQSKDERESKSTKAYVAGNAKEIVFNNNSPAAQTTTSGNNVQQFDNEDDLPF